MATERTHQSRRGAAKIRAIIGRLRKAYPDADCALRWTTPLELLIATILSAQCTDERVNQVTEDLFRECQHPGDYLALTPQQLEERIRSTGFFRNKAKAIHGTCRKLLADFDGRVPDTMEELLTLPGVARKTANVVLGTAFGKATGVVVDTHVDRLSRRIGLSRETNRDKIERDLMELIPRRHWVFMGHALILHGRQVCHARRPRCEVCVLEDVCEQNLD